MHNHSNHKMQRYPRPNFSPYNTSHDDKRVRPYSAIVKEDGFALPSPTKYPPHPQRVHYSPPRSVYIAPVTPHYGGDAFAAHTMQPIFHSTGAEGRNNAMASPSSVPQNLQHHREQRRRLERQPITSPYSSDGLSMYSRNSINNNNFNRRLYPHQRRMILSNLDRVDAYKYDYLELKPADMRFESHSNDTCEIKIEPSVVQATVECKICYDSISDNDAFALNCKHQFCTSCLSQYIEAQIDVGSVVDIVCPMSLTECGKPILQRELRAILGPRKFSKLDRFALESATNMDPNLRNCPTPDCPYIFYWEDQSKDSTSTSTPKFFCPLCDSTACLKCCISPYHEGISCSIFKSMPASSQHEELTSSYLKQLKNNARPCGRCGTIIVKKEGGCAKMKCRCGYRFCFICGVENAVCGHTPSHHGFTDNITGGADFIDLNDSKSPT